MTLELENWADGPSSLREAKTACLDLFLTGDISCLKVFPALLENSKLKLEFQALKELEAEGFLVRHSFSGCETFFLSEPIYEFKKSFNLSYDACTAIAEVYNRLAPQLIPEPSLFKKLSPSEVDEPVLEATLALVSLLSLTQFPESEFPIQDDEDGGDSKNDNTFELS